LWAENAVRAILIVLAFSAATVFYRQFQLYRDIVQRLFWSVYTVYNLVVGNLVSDVLSYARIFALGLTSALLAVTVNQLALMAGAAPLVGLPVALLVLLGGHTFNLFISTLGAYVHTSRLQYLEFFNKFYLGGGRPFEPLRRNYRYLKVE
jgi:V/A-type H+-transporting ATPase subunit I